MSYRPGLGKRYHPGALGIAPIAGSPFVTETSGGLAITRVLLADGSVADVRALPVPRGAERPAVFCPFCGTLGQYRMFRDGFRIASFAHAEDQDCSTTALETIRHQRAKKALVAGLRKLRSRGQPLLLAVTCRRGGEQFDSAILSAGEWDEEAPERRLPTGRVSDVVALARGTVVFAFEVFATHLVDEAKSAALNSGSVPCIELNASDLIDDHGEVLWTGEGPVPVARRAWRLEAAPRKFHICDSCRTVPSSYAVLRKALLRLREGEPLAAGQLEAELSVAVGPTLTGTSPIDQLDAAVLKPELFREHDPRAALALANRDTWPDAKDLLLSALRIPAGNPWEKEPIERLCRDPFEALCRRALARRDHELASPVSNDEEDDHMGFSQSDLELAERLSHALGASPGTSRHTAYAVRALWDHRRDGHTAITEVDLLRTLAATPRHSESAARAWLDGLASGHRLLVRDRRAGKVALVTDFAYDQRVASHPRITRRRFTRFVDGAPQVRETKGLNEKQRQAVRMVLTNSFSIITGGAGTGKTSAVKEILRRGAKQNSDRHWLLVAPSYKALNRLRESVKNVPARGAVHDGAAPNPPAGALV